MNTAAIVAVVLAIVFGEQIVAGLKSAYTYAAARLPYLSGGVGGIFNAKIEIKVWKAIALVGLLFVARGGVGVPEWKIPGLPSIPWPSIIQKADRATYVHEQRAGDVPADVKAAISKLNERGILATTFDKDTLDKLGGVTPEQYKIALAAAKVLPSLVVQGGPKVLKVVEKPTGEQVEAVQ